VVEDSESGFTLLELMMVVLIIAILIAVLMPTFLGARDRANDRATQSSIRNALTAAKAVYVDNQDYTQATPARLNAEGVPVQFVAANVDPTSQNMISVNNGSKTYLVLAGKSKTGTCFYISDDMAGTAGTSFARLPAGTNCEADLAPVQGDPAWRPAW
jgi:type IV pilus assembly protein PilA